jgi:hypothetical protein
MPRFYSFDHGHPFRSSPSESIRAAPSRDVGRIVDQFIDAWNADDERERRRLLEATCTEATEFSSPYGEHCVIAAQLASIAQF